MQSFAILLGKRPEQARRDLATLLDGPLSFAASGERSTAQFAITGKLRTGAMLAVDSNPD